jgi:hypothetical protein
MDKNEEPVVIRTMMGARQLEMACQCLGSIKTFVRHPLAFAIHNDGSLDDAAKARLEELLAPCTFVEKDAAGEAIAARLDRYPRCARFRREHLFGLKLFDIPMLAGTRVIYCDTDILFTRPVVCPAYFLGSGSRFVAMRDLQESYAVRFARWPLLKSHGIPLASRICAGMISFDRDVLDLDYVEWLLGVDERTGLFDGFPFWAEQTIYAALAARAGSAWIEPKQCIIAERGLLQTRELPAIIHFAGFYRPLLDPVFRRLDLVGDLRPPRVLSTQAAPRCTPWRRAVSAVRRRFLIKSPPPYNALARAEPELAP